MPNIKRWLRPFTLLTRDVTPGDSRYPPRRYVKGPDHRPAGHAARHLHIASPGPQPYEHTSIYVSPSPPSTYPILQSLLILLYCKQTRHNPNIWCKETRRSLCIFAITPTTSILYPYPPDCKEIRHSLSFPYPPLPILLALNALYGRVCVCVFECNLH